MLVIGTFEHSIELEQFFAVIEQKGTPREQILVIPMDTRPNPQIKFINKLGDLHTKAVETGMAFATASSVVGTSMGFAYSLGPIFLGLIAASIGFFLGFGIYLIINRNNYRQLPKRLPEITVIIQCPDDQSIPIMETMWKYRVLTVGQVHDP